MVSNGTEIRRVSTNENHPFSLVGAANAHAKDGPVWYHCAMTRSGILLRWNYSKIEQRVDYRRAIN